MNVAAAQYRKMLGAHVRRAEAEERSLPGVRRVGVGLLERIVAEY